MRSDSSKLGKRNHTCTPAHCQMHVTQSQIWTRDVMSHVLLCSHLVSSFLVCSIFGQQVSSSLQGCFCPMLLLHVLTQGRKPQTNYAKHAMYSISKSRLRKEQLFEASRWILVFACNVVSRTAAEGSSCIIKNGSQQRIDSALLLLKCLSPQLLLARQSILEQQNVFLRQPLMLLAY